MDLEKNLKKDNKRDKKQSGKRREERNERKALYPLRAIGTEDYCFTLSALASLPIIQWQMPSFQAEKQRYCLLVVLVINRSRSSAAWSA